MQYLKDEVRRRILEAGLAEFRERGYRDASVRRIARAAGVTPGNLYHYYAGKPALFDAVVGPAYNGLMLSLGRLRDMDSPEALSYLFRPLDASDGYPGINALVDALLAVCQTRSAEVLILMEKSAGGPGRYGHMKNDLIGFLGDILTDKVLPVLPDGGRRAQKSGIAAILAVAFIEGFCSILKTAKNGAEVVALAEQLITLFFKDVAERLRAACPSG